jgi:Flp pilus assembly pilin Flp
MNSFFSLLRDDSGQGVLEYALVISIVSIAAVAALKALGSKTTSVLSNVNKAF